MLYRYLFNKHATDSIDWTKFWAHEGLSPDDLFSPSFLLQIQAICLGNDLDDMSNVKNLGEMAEYLRDLHLQIGELQSELELVYRWRGGGSSRRIESANYSSSTVSKSKQREMKRERKENTPIVQVEQAAAAAASQPNTNNAANPMVIEDSGTVDKPISIDDDEMAPVAENKTDVAEDSGMSVDAPEIAVATVPTELQEPTTGSASATGTDEIKLNGMEVEDPTVETTTKDASKDNTTPAIFDDIWDIVNQPNLFKHEKITLESQQIVDSSSSEDGIGDEEDEELQGMIIGKREFKYNEINMLEHVRNNLSFWNGRVSSDKLCFVAVCKNKRADDIHLPDPPFTDSCRNPKVSI